MLQRLKDILLTKGHVLYTRPYELNIVGMRSQNTISNRFDDEIHVFYRVGVLKWNYHVFKATTDPGTYWLDHPMEPQGTAILAQGQYRNAYAIGLHRGEYNALVQVGPVTIIRDYDRRANFDLLNGTHETGVYGINIHHAAYNGTTTYVDEWSAGCQVFANIDDFNFFMKLCEQHRQLYGNAFTYTLIDFRALKRAGYRNLAMGATLLSLALFTLYYYDND